LAKLLFYGEVKSMLGAVVVWFLSVNVLYHDSLSYFLSYIIYLWCTSFPGERCSSDHG